MILGCRPWTTNSHPEPLFPVSISYNMSVVSRHQTYRRKGFDTLLFQMIPTQIKVRIIHRQSTLRPITSAQQRLDWNMGHAMIAAIGRVLEVQRCGPVVGEVLGHLARGAGGARADVTCHGGVEGIASNDVVHMSGGEGAGLGGRIEALEG